MIDSHLICNDDLLVKVGSVFNFLKAISKKEH